MGNRQTRISHPERRASGMPRRPWPWPTLGEQLTANATAAAATQPAIAITYGSTKANKDNLRGFQMPDGTIVQSELLKTQRQARRQEQGLAFDIRPCFGSYVRGKGEHLCTLQGLPERPSKKGRSLVQLEPLRQQLSSWCKLQVESRTQPKFSKLSLCSRLCKIFKLSKFKLSSKLHQP
jgi:hypothetical protein